jgi:hypothetical protein
MCGKGLTYDANGNTLTMPGYWPGGLVNAGKTRSFAYDGANLPLAVQDSTSATAGIALVYGPDGRRLRNSQGPAASPTSQTWYPGDGQELRVDSANPSGLWTKYVTPDVKIVGTGNTSETVTFLHKGEARLAGRSGGPSRAPNARSASAGPGSGMGRAPPPVWPPPSPSPAMAPGILTSWGCDGVECNHLARSGAIRRAPRKLSV